MPYEGTYKLPEASATKEIEWVLIASGKSYLYKNLLATL